MANLFTRSLLGKLVSLFLLVALIPIAIVGYLSFEGAEAALRKAEFDKLMAERELRKNLILEYLHNAMDSLVFLAGTASVVDSFRILLWQVTVTQGKTSSGGIDVTSDAYKKLCEDMAPTFAWFIELHAARSALQDILLVDGKDGNVMYSNKRGPDWGASFKTGTLKDTGTARVWEKVVSTRKPALMDFSMYKPFGAASLYAGAPVIGPSGEIVGVLIARLGTEQIAAIMKAAQSVGTGGQAYLVGKDKVLRAHSVDERNSGILKDAMDTEAVSKVVSGEQGTGIINDDKGNKVLSSYAPAGIKEDPGLFADFDWGVIVQREAKEAFRPVSALAWRGIVISVLMGALATVMAVIVSGSIAKPVIALSEHLDEVSKGNLAVVVPETSRADEIGGA